MAVAEPAGSAVGDAADGAEGRLASADVEDVGFAEVVGRVAEAVGAAELAARVCAAGVEPVGVALGFAGAADVRGAVPGDAVCATADFDAAVDVFETGGVASDDDAAAVDEAATRGDFREPEVDAEDSAEVDADAEVEGALAVEADADADAALGVDVAGAAERVGGIGESPDPKSETSSTGEAQVPEYAASEGAAAHEPEVELVAEAPGALEAEEPPDAMERAKAVAPAAEVPSAASADLELPAFVAATGESGDEALEILVAGLAELGNTGPDAFAATAA
jgi:hypothetical protein